MQSNSSKTAPTLLSPIPTHIPFKPYKKHKAIPAQERCSQDEKYWTSAGVTARMDMSLAIMKEIYGERYTQAIMLDMEYDPTPPIIGENPEKTSWMVNWMMKAMYDEGVQPLLDSLEQESKI